MELSLLFLGAVWMVGLEHGVAGKRWVTPPGTFMITLRCSMDGRSIAPTELSVRWVHLPSGSNRYAGSASGSGGRLQLVHSVAVG